MPSVKCSHHISPTLRKLHFAQYQSSNELITKLLSLLLKLYISINRLTLLNFLFPETSTRPLRSVSQHKLRVPFIKSKLGERSFQLFLHLLSGTLFPLTFALVLQSLPFILFSKLISFLLRSLLTWTDFLANGLHVFDPSLVARLGLIMWVTWFC